MSKIIRITALLLLGFYQWGFSQPMDAWVKAGDKAFTQNHQDAAFQYYGIALEYDSNRYDLWYKYAEAARQFGVLLRAEKGYRKVLSSDAAPGYPLATYWLADVSQRLGNYQEATALYRRFLEEQPNADERYRNAALKGAADSEWAPGVISNKSERIHLKHLDGGINSSYSDFGTALKGDTLYYSSFQFINEKDTINPPRPYIKIMQSIGGAAGTPLSDKINVKERHVAHTSFNGDFTRVYYNICDYISTAEIRCDMYSSKIAPNGDWGPAEPLSINLPNATTTEPCFATDLLTGKNWLYFSSNRPGGKGELDIWRSEVAEDGTLRTPENLAAINTPGNEATPFFHGPSYTLYFSTDGYQTLGGFDIYNCRQTLDGWATPQHMGVPVNSSYNDVYYMVVGQGEKGYLSSNRPDTSAVFWDDTKESCCNDIYELAIDTKVDLLVKTFNGLDSTELKGAKVELYELTPEGPKLVATIDNPTGNDFNFPLEAGKRYSIIGSRPGFAPAVDTIDLSRPELQGQAKIERRLYLNPGVELNVSTFQLLDSTALKGVTVDLYEITPDGQEVLVQSRTNLNGNDFNFPLERGKNYVIKGHRQGYAPVEERIDLTQPEYANATRIDKKLYLGQMLEALTFDADTREPLNGVKIELLELGPGEPMLVDSLTNFTGNNFLFPLDLNKTYIIKATKPGYRDLMDTLRFNLQDMVNANGKATIELYMERISFNDFLPLTLYFDNAIPDPRSYLPTTDKVYIPLNESYYNRRQEFITQNTETLTGEDRFRTTRRFNDFFEREVKGGRLDLEAFTDRLHVFLQNGNSISIKIQGYCSPRGAAQYNNLLSARRVDSVKNHFKQYKNGCLGPYLRSGKLRIQEEALGESKSPKGISDRLNDPKGSIFGILASLERRVEIVEVKTGNE